MTKEVKLVRGLKYKVPLQKNNSRAQNAFGRSGFEETLHSRLVLFLTRKPEKKNLFVWTIDLSTTVNVKKGCLIFIGKDLRSDTRKE